MNLKYQLENRLKLLESDLADSNNPQVLARYPHLGSTQLKYELGVRIEEVKRQLGLVERSSYRQDEQLVGDQAEQPRDKVVEAVRADLLRRSQLGIQKYGMTLERKDLSLKQWLQHAYEETLDQANYLKRVIIEIEQREEEQS